MNTTIGNKMETFFNMFPNYRNMSETKRKICVWVSIDMYNDVVKAGYDSPTVAVIKGFELLIREAEYRQNAGNLEQAAAQITADNINLKNEVQRLTLARQDTPDPIELAQLRAKHEELEKHNETLKVELRSTSQREQDLKKTFDNYMVQVQSLINQKVIEVPGAKKPWWRFW
jgi:hypothetical protein